MMPTKKRSVSKDEVLTKSFFLKYIKGFDGKFLSIDQRFEKIDQRFEKIDQRFEQIDQRFETVDKRFDEMKLYIDHKIEFVRRDTKEQLEGLERRMNRRFERIESELGSTQIAVREVKHDVVRIEAKLIEHDQRFDRIESKLIEHDQRFDRIETKVDQIGPCVALHDVQIAKLQSAVG